MKYKLRNGYRKGLFQQFGDVYKRQAAYREYQSALRAFNQRLAVLRQCLGMQSALSTYAARHTWATLAYHCEIHPGIISEAMGHSSDVYKRQMRTNCKASGDRSTRKV